MLTGKTWSTWRMTCPNDTLSTKNPTRTDLGLNVGLCGKRLESKQLSNGTALDLSGVSVMDINSNVVRQYWNVLPVITLPALIWQNVAVQNLDSNSLQHYCSDDVRVLDILLWSVVLTVKRGKCWTCIVLLTGMESGPWRLGFLSKYIQKFKAWTSKRKRWLVRNGS